MAKLDFDYLLFAWQDDSPDNSYYLNVESGQVELVQADLLDLNDLTDVIERNRERYLYLPKPDASELRSDLQEYIAGIDNPDLKRLLSVAFEASDPLFACKGLLAKSGDELQRWEEFRRQKVETRIRKWLAANFINLS